MLSVVSALMMMANMPLEWTGHLHVFATPPLSPCLPLRSSVSRMPGKPVELDRVVSLDPLHRRTGRWQLEGFPLYLLRQRGFPYGT